MKFWTTAAVICLLPALTQGQGPLTPSGPPAPSMRTLQQIEPRTPLETLPIIISEPGNYYLTRSWDFEGTSSPNAIRIQSSDVTVDLGGYSLSSLDAEVILLAAGVKNIRIANGILRNSGKGLVGTTADHVTLENLDVRELGAPSLILGEYARLQNCQVRSAGAGAGSAGTGVTVGRYAVLEKVAVYDCGGGISAGARSVLRDCSAFQCGPLGFTLVDSRAYNLVAAKNGAGLSLTRCTLEGGAIQENGPGVTGTDSTLRNVTAEANTGAGFSLTRGSAQDCVAKDNQSGFVLVDTAATSCQAYSNTLIGFDLTRGSIRDSEAKENQTGFVLSQAIAADCLAHDNDIRGFYSTSGVNLENCRAISNDNDGFEVVNATLAGCSAASNGVNGFEATTSTLSQCSAVSNSRSGFLLSSSVADQLQAQHNTEVGIECLIRTQVIDSRVENNQFSGIVVGSDCVVRGNLCSSNGTAANTNAYAGIFAGSTHNRIEGNQCIGAEGADNDFGIQVKGATDVLPAVTGNVIIGNTAGGNGGGNYDIPAGNYVGEILTTGSSATSASANANFEL